MYFTATKVAKIKTKKSHAGDDVEMLEPACAGGNTFI